MSKEVMGVSLARLENPIRTALKTYEDSSGNDLEFDTDGACKLDPTPTKSNSARSETAVVFRGEQIGKLYVIAFKPGDGTGSEVNYQLADLNVSSPYPRDVRVVPRNKTGIHSEGHLIIVRHGIDNSHAEPELFAGTLDLLGLEDGTVIKIGELGHPVTEKSANPVTTLTVGHGEEGLRFGDPHSVYSSIQQSLQVSAFLAISNAVHEIYPDILDGLKPQLPLKP